MKTRKGYAQAYNAQPALTADQIILAARVTNEANDQAECLRGRMPKNLTPGERMKRSLDTKAGQETYALRGQTMEPVNGQLKADGASQMLWRGLAKVQSDFTAACLRWRSGWR